MPETKKIFSAIQPTGDIHFGNYFGAVKNWVRLQSEYDTVFGVVDYHAMTMAFNHNKLRNQTWELVFNLLAIGIKPENLMVQSLVPEHTELNWILNCFCSFGQLTRMTQFKDKSQSVQDNFISVGLLNYPVLQAADILIYHSDYVPVGKDQEQHLELSRNIAQRFNNQVGKDYFPLPEALFTPTPKIRSTADPSRKMSKSAGEKHYISLFADDKVLIKKVRSAVTDTGDTTNGEMSEGVTNLFEILNACDATEAYHSLMADYQNGALKYSDLKEVVTQHLLRLTRQFKERKAEITADKKKTKGIIKDSSADIRKRAQKTVLEVKELCGLMNVKL